MTPEERSEQTVRTQGCLICSLVNAGFRCYMRQPLSEAVLPQANGKQVVSDPRCGGGLPGFSADTAPPATLNTLKSRRAVCRSAVCKLTYLRVISRVECPRIRCGRLRARRGLFAFMLEVGDAAGTSGAPSAGRCPKVLGSGEQCGSGIDG